MELPENTRAVKFSAPEDMGDNINDAVGLQHLDEEGNPTALEFMFELTKDEIKVLRHEPYITFTVISDHLHPFSLQTTFPYEQKYDSLVEHQHVCTANVKHDTNRWWRCDNPSHNTKENRLRMCDDCWESNNNFKEPTSELSEDELT